VESNHEEIKDLLLVSDDDEWECQASSAPMESKWKTSCCHGSGGKDSSWFVRCLYSSTLGLKLGIVEIPLGRVPYGSKVVIAGQGVTI